MSKAKYTNEQFIEAFNSSFSVREILIKLGINPIGGNYKTVHKKAKFLQLDIAKFNSIKMYRKIKETITNEQIIFASKSNRSMRGTLKSLMLPLSGGSYIWLQNKIKELDINTSHFTGQGHLRGKTHNWGNAIPLEDILVKDSYYQSHRLKLRLIKAGIIENKCLECGISEWKGKALSLHLDHKNGDNTDNQLENLRLLCPNCHSQTETYCGKNI